MRFSNPFRKAEGDEVSRLLRESQEKVEKEYGPIGKLGLAITAAATNTRDRTRKYLKISDEKERLEREIYLFYEHLYFFTHLGLREAFLQLSDGQRDKVLKYLLALIPPAAVDSYFAHWPDDLKQKMTGEFVAKLTESQNEYLELAKGSTAEKPEEQFFELLIFHATHVTQLCEREADWESIRKPLVDIFFDEWKRANFEQCASEIKRAS